MVSETEMYTIIGFLWMEVKPGSIFRCICVVRSFEIVTCQAPHVSHNVGSVPICVSRHSIEPSTPGSIES